MSTEKSEPIFRNYVLAGYPLLWVETYEEYRAMTVFAREVASVKGKTMFSWDRVDGIKTRTLKNGILESARVKVNTDGVELDDPVMALDWANETLPQDGILFLLDFHTYAKKDHICRRIRNMIPRFKAAGRMLVIVSHAVDIPPELEKEVTVVHFKLPDRDELKSVLQSLCDQTNNYAKDYPKDDNAILEAALGMTWLEAENAFAMSLVERKGEFDPELIRREKAAIVRKTGLLEVVDSKVSLDEVGGLENIKAWLLARQNSFSNKARDFGIIPPKGALIVGVPGCGKSLISKAVASTWGRPLLRLDMGRMMGSYVGESENNLRKSLGIAEAVQPVVLWVDELEKSFSGTGGSDSDGHGTTKRTFSTFLVWCQERTADVFLVATANNVRALPPELLRRFDVTFWVDLPTGKQREEILTIHLKKIKRDPKKFDLKSLSKASKGLTGSEIEVWVREALTVAFQKGAELSTDILLSSVDGITPISRMMQADIDASRQWAKERGIKTASEEEIEGPVSEGSGRRKVNMA